MAKRKSKGVNSAIALFAILGAGLICAIVYMSGASGTNNSGARKASGVTSEGAVTSSEALTTISPGAVALASASPGAVKSTQSDKGNSNSAAYKDSLKLDDPKEVESSRMYVKRAVLELNELSSIDQGQKLQPVADPNGELDKDQGDKYASLVSQIDENKAVYMMQKLKKDFGGTQKVFDEYLLSLQLGLDLENYIKDKASYEKARDEKMSGKEPDSILNVEKIERLYLESLQKQNEKNRAGNVPGLPKNPTGSNSGIPAAPGAGAAPAPYNPQVDVPRPPDPAADIRKSLGR